VQPLEIFVDGRGFRVWLVGGHIVIDGVIE
jgi:hypothetical protein